nr:NADH dehydrogenase subunit 4L [Octodonta nipae]
MKFVCLSIFISNFMGFMSFCFNYKHFIFMLLSLEFLVVSVYYFMVVYLSMNMMNMFFLMIFLTISVCEGVLGLSIMVLMVRMEGNDFMLSFCSLW